jgi:hypothetical protein
MVPLGRSCVTGFSSISLARGAGAGPGREVSLPAGTPASYGMSWCVPQSGPSSPDAELVTCVRPVPSALTV